MLKSDPIFVKPYVKEYLINNFGVEIEIPEDNFIMAAFRLCAQRKKKMKDKLLAQRKSSKGFGDDTLVPVCFTLSQHTYVNYGYYLTPTEEMVFRSFLEKMVKALLDNTYDTTAIAAEKFTVSKAVEYFRRVTNVSEESFTEEAVRKYIYRRKKRLRPKEPEGTTLFNYADRNNSTHSSKTTGP